MKRKGILLAGGLGTRLYPLTQVISKQLLTVYDKPLIYYPLTTLMLAGINEILIISTPRDLPMFKKIIGDGSQWGLKISFKEQPKPDGLAQAIVLAENFLGDDLSALILGDNIFYGHDIGNLLNSASNREKGATIFTYHVNDPERYGVAEFDDNGKVISIQEKPEKPRSNFAVTGLYFYDNKVTEYVKKVKPSKRGELEITDLNKIYQENGSLFVEKMNRGYSWLDTGTHDSLLTAGQFISTIENRQGLKIACPEEIAYRNNWISKFDLENLAIPLLKNQYGQYLLKVANEN